MTTFEDGPAKGQTFMLRRCPIFVRVTFDGKKWDVLNELADTPRHDEQLHAYQLTAHPTWMHVRATGGRGGMFYSGIYKTLKESPDDSTMRNEDLWTAWCKRQSIAYLDGEQPVNNQ